MFVILICFLRGKDSNWLYYPYFSANFKFIENKLNNECEWKLEKKLRIFDNQLIGKDAAKPNLKGNLLNCRQVVRGKRVASEPVRVESLQWNEKKKRILFFILYRWLFVTCVRDTFVLRLVRANVYYLLRSIVLL